MISIVVITYFTALGMLSFSKQAMLSPLLSRVIGVFYTRMKIRFVHLVVLVLMGVANFGFVSPLSASGDLSENMDYSQRFQLVSLLITHWDKVEQHVKDQKQYLNENGVNEYYNEEQESLLERLSIIPPDDTMMAYAAKGNFEGIAPVVNYFENIPHFVAPNKQIWYRGNYYAHEIGFGIGADDYSTGICFSPVAETYHCEGW